MPEKERTIMSAHVNVAEAERWASALGGAALATWGFLQLRDERTPTGAMLTAAGASLIARGATGHCPVYAAAGVHTSRTDTRAALDGPRGILVDHAATINRRPDELYAYWRKLEQLPRFMSHLISVEQLDERRSHWVARGPAGRKVSWDAEIISDTPNELIGWRTLEKSDVVSAGSVRFRPAPGGRGTEVRVRLQYEPPAGRVGATIAWLLGDAPEQAIQEDLRRFKQLIEACEVPTIQGQPRGRQSIFNYS
jgi:uncharacterized membrane protein